MSDIRADVNVLKEGYVFKLAGFFRKTWEPRYFRLRGRQLLYYKNETDGTPRQSLCNLMFLVIISFLDCGY